MKNKHGFTILEMMIVLSIIALIFLLTLPNIQQKQKIIHDTGCDALIEVVNAQILLYEIENLHSPSNINELIAEGYLKEGQNRCPAGEMIGIAAGEAYVQ